MHLQKLDKLLEVRISLSPIFWQIQKMLTGYVPKRQSHGYHGKLF